MVELLREKKRQYVADKSEAIKIGQQAQFWGDVAQVMGAGSSIVNSMATIEKNRQREADKRASSHLSSHGKEAESIVADIRNQYGENITSEKGQQAVRDALGKHFRNYRPQDADARTGEAYDKGADEYINQVIDSNYLFATRSKIDRQNRERATQEKERQKAIKSTANVAQDLNDLYIQQSGELGKIGADDEFKQLTSETSKQFDKILEKVPGTQKQKADMKAAAIASGELNRLVNMATSDDMAVVERADMILHDQEEFDNFISPEFIDAAIDSKKTEVLDNWARQRAVLKNTAMTASGKNKESLDKQIAEIDKKMASLSDNNEIDGKDFDSEVKNQVRTEFAATAKPFITKALGERELDFRIAENQRKKEDAAIAMADPLRPEFKLELIRLAKEEEAHADDPQMSFVDGKKPKGFWKEFADNVMGYADNMSHVSQLAYTDVNVQGDANAMIKQLAYEEIESPTGDPMDFEYKVFKTAHEISGLPMSESDRINKQNQLSKLLLANDEDVQMLRAVLESGEVGVIPAKDRFGWEQIARQRDYEPGTIQGYLAKEDYVLSAFDKYMYHAEQEYLNLGLNMWANGATYDQIMVERNKIFKKHVDNFYREFHLTNLADLDEKLKNHEPAFAKFNGITYEYKGRGSDQRPIWYDHAVLNTNRDFTRFLEKKPMKDTNKRDDNE